jgi:hypothetical protein
MPTRDHKVNRLLAQGADDERRLQLDELDRVARASSTFGSNQHRQGRDTVERAHDAARHALEQLSDQQLDDRLV